MTNPKGFDPLATFISACMTLLFGAIALAVAVSLIQQIWVWLILIISAVGVIWILVRLVIGWSRGQSW